MVRKTINYCCMAHLFSNYFLRKDNCYMSTSSPSLLLPALDQTIALVISPLPQESIIHVRNVGPKPEGTFAYLDGVVMQITQVQFWLRYHTDMLALLDKGIQDEVRKMERRVTWTNILSNLTVTILETILRSCPSFCSSPDPSLKRSIS
jgi:hypothetical protein